MDGSRLLFVAVVCLWLLFTRGCCLLVVAVYLWLSTCSIDRAMTKMGLAGLGKLL
jgi:hypothetical protein